MPRGLGGSNAPQGSSEALVLQRATCEDCREITRRVEEACLQQALNPARVRMGMVRKDRRKPLETVWLRMRDGREERHELESKHMVGALVLPAYRAAKLTPEWQPGAGVDYKFIVTTPAEQVPNPDVEKFGVQLRFDALMFARMTAKIALGLAVAHLGVDGFSPLVQDLILGKTKDYELTVGGYADEPQPPPEQGSLHRYELSQIGPFWVVDLRLFASHGGPTNYVIVGLAIPPDQAR